MEEREDEEPLESLGFLGFLVVLGWADALAVAAALALVAVLGFHVVDLEAMLQEQKWWVVDAFAHPHHQRPQTTVHLCCAL